ncbi:tRNA lysidine(34) synthetase TilS [Croceitalea marina]|uniref:tRNA(Ile)-lysidine synthase n=1 Tax=Croceitalea marina TaxID=1775166 RepID=A0ABW5MWG5_9FLAO
MLANFKSHIELTFPFLKETKLLLACSGGLDSVVLSYLLRELNFDFALVHCNFNLRGDESNQDMEFVEKLAVQLMVPFYSKSFDTEYEMQQRGGSVQMVARNLRYEWFQDLLKTEGYEYVITAHHADDALETFLINLSRGTGIDGLTGIPHQNEKIIRPLLPFSQSEIVQYASSNEIKWREDSSNASTKYLRNQIRHKIVPELKETNTNFLNNFLSTQDKLLDSSSILDDVKVKLQKDLFLKEDDKIKVHIEKLNKLRPLRAYLHLLFNEFGFTAWKDVQHLLQASSGKEIVSEDFRLLKDRKHLFLTPIRNEDLKSYLIPSFANSTEIPLKLEIEEVSSLSETGKNILYADMEKLKLPLLLRKWKNGDYFYPLGMNGKKKLSKYFKDEKVNLLAKNEQWLLSSNENIVWVIGRRADERFKVTPKTKRIVKITWHS